MRRWLRILAVMAVTVAVTMKYGAQLYFGGPQYSAADGTQLSACQMIESVTQDGMTLRAFFDETGTIVASMAEDAYRLVLAYPGGPMYTFPKNAKGEVEMARARQTETYARAPFQAPDTAQP